MVSYTLDGYCANYPLSYKHEFREVIAAELEKHNENRKYFDYWGSRCYFYVGELKGNGVITKDEFVIIQNLDFDVAQFKAMGGKYFLSAVEIGNHADIDLKFHRSFETENSPYKIVLYEAL